MNRIPVCLRIWRGSKEQGLRRFPVIPDDYEKIRRAVKEAAQKYDLVIINAGSSAGTEDYTVHVLRELGEVVVHGVGD